MIGRVVGLGLSGFVGLMLLSTALGSWYTIDQGERGVVLRNGALYGVADPGLHWKVPFIDSVHYISTQSVVKRFEHVEAYSRDQQPADMMVSVNFRILSDKVADVYASYGGMDGLVARQIDTKLFPAVKTVFGQFAAATAIQERGRLNQEVFDAVGKSLDGNILIESVNIENIDFSKVYEESVEARMLAEVEVAKLHQNAEREKVQAQITVTKATAEADAVRARALADAAAITLKGEAEATAITARGKALSENTNLIKLVEAEKWNGQLPTTMVPGSAVPFLNVGTSDNNSLAIVPAK